MNKYESEKLISNKILNEIYVHILYLSREYIEYAINKKFKISFPVWVYIKTFVNLTIVLLFFTIILVYYYYLDFYI